MIFTTRVCGWLVASIWLTLSVVSFFYVYFLLTFSFFGQTETLVEAFHAEPGPVAFWSLAGIAFLVGSCGVALHRSWAKQFSIVLSVIGLCVVIAQFLSSGLGRLLDLTLNPMSAAGIVAVLISILGWLYSRGGRNYFQRAADPA